MNITTIVIAVLGALVYGFSPNSKVAEIGRLVFACAFLWLAYQLSNGHLPIFR